MGANIKGVGSNFLKIEGVSHLSGTKHKILPDMIEIGSWIGLAAMTQSEIRIKNASLKNLGNILSIFQKMGINNKITHHLGRFIICINTIALYTGIAASQALRKYAQEADPCLLEPVMKVEVVTPEENMGDVMGDLNRRRGLVQGMDDTPAGKVINAQVPLGEMFGYATDLRSATQGRASYSMEFECYAEAPQNIAEAVINQA